MARGKNKGLLPWLTLKPDGKEKRFIQVGNSLMTSKDSPFTNPKIKPGARYLYLCLALESGGKEQVTFPHNAAKKYGFAKNTFDRYIKALQEYDLIEQVQDGNYYQYTANIYRFKKPWISKAAPHFGDS